MDKIEQSADRTNDMMELQFALRYCKTVLSFLKSQINCNKIYTLSETIPISTIFGLNQ